MKTWSTREIPDALWRRVKEKAAMEGKTIKSLFFGWLYEYIEPKPEGREGEKDEKDGMG